MTLEDLIKEAAREGTMRRAVYPNSKGSPEAKARQLQAMDKIERVLAIIADSKAFRPAVETLAGLEPQQPQLI